MSDILKEEISALTEKCGADIIVLNTCGSTNTVARELAERGASELTVVIAREQSAGRGRLGRSFFSPSNSGLYMSIILRPNICVESALEITTAAAVAAAQVIAGYTQKHVGIKWVNDIYIDFKKVCGILTESSIDTCNGKLEYAVLGIGVDLFKPIGGFPSDIADIADSVLDCEPNEHIKACFAAELINKIASMYPHIGKNSYIEDYKQLSIMRGLEVYVIGENGNTPATVLDIGDDHSLIVRYADGKVSALRTGDVSIKLATRT